jgi:hypothetical protein
MVQNATMKPLERSRISSVAMKLLKSMSLITVLCPYSIKITVNVEQITGNSTDFSGNSTDATTVKNDVSPSTMVLRLQSRAGFRSLMAKISDFFAKNWLKMNFLSNQNLIKNPGLIFSQSFLEKYKGGGYKYIKKVDLSTHFKNKKYMYI